MPTRSIARLPAALQTEFYTLAHSLARRVAHNEADVDDLTQEAIFSLLRSLKRRGVAPNKQFAFARTVMLRAMQTYYAGGWRSTGTRQCTYDEHPLDKIPEQQISVDPSEQLDTELVVQQYLNDLQQACGPLAHRVAYNLIAPRDPAYCQHLITHHKRKRRTQKKVRVTNKRLREALELSRGRWRRTLREIREFTRCWLQEHAETPTAR